MVQEIVPGVINPQGGWHTGGYFTRGDWPEGLVPQTVHTDNFEEQVAGTCPKNSNWFELASLKNSVKLVWIRGTNLSVSPSIKQSINQLIKQTKFLVSVSQSVKSSIYLSVSPMSSLICQSIKQPIKQLVKQTTLFKEWHSTNVRVVHYALLSRVTESRRQRIQGAAAEQKNTRVNFLEMQ